MIDLKDPACFSFKLHNILNLEHCPFCGHPAIWKSDDWNPNRKLYRILCVSCKSTTPWVKTLEIAQGLWNHRIERNEKDHELNDTP